MYLLILSHFSDLNPCAEYAPIYGVKSDVDLNHARISKRSQIMASPTPNITSVHLLVFLVGLLSDELRLGELGFQNGDAVVLHVGSVLQRLAYSG